MLWLYRFFNFDLVCTSKRQICHFIILTNTAKKKIHANVKNKPNVIIHYNKTKGPVDTGDKMTSEYSCVRATRRWPFRLFLEMIDMAALNAYVVYKLRYPEWKIKNKGNRKIFIENLANNLMKGNVVERHRVNPHLHQDVISSINLFYKHLNIFPPTAESRLEPAIKKIKRCELCPRVEDKKDKKQYSVCKKFICLEHSNIICNPCLSGYSSC